MSATINVPTTIVLMSKRLLRGSQPSDQSVDRSTFRRKSIVPPNRLSTMPMLINTESSAAEKKRARIRRSRRRRAGLPRSTSAVIGVEITAWAIDPGLLSLRAPSAGIYPGRAALGSDLRSDPSPPVDPQADGDADDSVVCHVLLDV